MPFKIYDEDDKSVCSGCMEIDCPCNEDDFDHLCRRCENELDEEDGEKYCLKCQKAMEELCTECGVELEDPESTTVCNDCESE